MPLPIDDGNVIKRDVELVFRKRKALMKVEKEVRRNRIQKQLAAKKRLKSIIPIPQHIPDEIIQEILHRLPPNSLIQWGCVSKLWFNTICRNHIFATTHLRRQLPNKKLRLSFHLSWDCPPKCGYTIKEEFFYLEKDEIDVKKSYELFTTSRPLVFGHCNGLYCYPYMDAHQNFIWVCNPSRDEVLSICPPPIANYDADNAIITCMGFGFDSLSNKYKLVFVARSTFGGEFKCFIFTFGADSCWREVTINLNSSNMFRASDQLWTLNKSSVFCNGVLYWRGATEPYPLISFDLHHESFHLIRFPTECISADEKQQQLVHLLDYKGALCVARLEKQSGSQNLKLHLHTLRDRIKQVWIKETPVVLPFPLPLLDATRLMGFSDDRILFHWFDGKDFQLRDMHMKYVKVVMPPASHVEYHVNNLVENVLCLRTFVPAKASRLFDVDMNSLKKYVFESRREFGLFVLTTKSVFKAACEAYMDY
ncbi:F-box protein At5g65850-like [Papaver somniferum]|uniref:F-box protein At5g65850-like n=1 Tax=Papaver somniferum TaxID=3469 RepID=UPI000E6FB38C|nr:F-box protein At5g65850-like [Papaver somniferum]